MLAITVFLLAVQQQPVTGKYIVLSSAPIAPTQIQNLDVISEGDWERREVETEYGTFLIIKQDGASYLLNFTDLGFIGVRNLTKRLENIFEQLSEKSESFSIEINPERLPEVASIFSGNGSLPGTKLSNFYLVPSYNLKIDLGDSKVASLSSEPDVSAQLNSKELVEAPIQKPNEQLAPLIFEPLNLSIFYTPKFDKSERLVCQKKLLDLYYSERAAVFARYNEIVKTAPYQLYSNWAENPKFMRSDNGLNFGDLKKEQQEGISSALRSRGIYENHLDSKLISAHQVIRIVARRQLPDGSSATVTYVLPTNVE